MNKTELRKKLNQPYDQQQWKDVVEFVFPHFSEFAGNQNLPVEPKDQDIVESFKQLGQVRLADGKNLALFELKLKENVNIIRNRVALNDIVSSYIDQEQFHGVLSVFEQGQDDYRFTFAARASEFDEDAGDFVNKKTDTKRFTYVLGKNESCRTAAERFYQLSQQKDKADINAIEHAFSVETLSKNFFKDYKQQYELFVEYLTQTPSYYSAVFDNEDKAIRDWVKLLLGRLVFIKFVQKKGWLGVPADEVGWRNGNYNFLEEVFTNFKHQDNFYSAFLNPLFFDGFDQPNRPNDVFELTSTKVPFLSGGLFDNEDPKTKTINFPKAYFDGLFDFLSRYNFTIDENDTSMDREVGIDPEMLGHIFENLLEDNKDKGAFYTPKEIVRYMCQESLTEYLKTFLQEQNQWPSDGAKEKELDEALHNFVTKKEAGPVIEFDDTLAQALKDVKICDPAIGSGAFPMGLLNEIFHLVHKLYDASPDKVGAIWKMNSWQPDVVKLNIIQQSIYGVDIEKGAVEIARLRFWLSLVVDSDEPHALPHLDYKIVVGDSLVSKLEDTIIDIDWEVTDENAQTDMFGNSNVEQRKAILEDITTKQKQIFDPDCDDEALSLEIRNLKIDLLINQLELMIKTQGLEDKPTVVGRNLKKQTELWLETKGWKQQIQRLKKMKQGSKTPLEFFDWKLDFPEITTKTGFDIIIANPPYIKEYTNRHAFDGFRNSQYYQGKMDLWYGFACVCLDLLKENGVECFIAQNNWITSAGASIFRNKVLKESEIRLFTDFWNFKVFKTAGIQTMVYLLKKTIPRNNYLLKYTVCKDEDMSEKKLPSLLDFKLLDELNGKFIIKFKYENYLDQFITFNNPKIDNVLNSLINNEIIYLNEEEIAQGIVYPQDKLNKKNAEKLGRNFNINEGIFQLSHDELNNLNLNANEKNLIKPFYSTSELHKYFGSSDNKEWVIYTKSEIKYSIDEYPNIKTHLDKYAHIITSDNKPYGLHRARNEIFFKGEKIISLRKNNQPCFTYTNFDCYVTQTFYSIKTNRINLKYLTALLNSKLIAFWLRFKGKMQGNNYQIDKEPLINIPIKISNKENEFIKLVDEILKLKAIGKETLELEEQVDNLVYKLYELTYEEVLIIEPAFSERMSKSEYEALEVE